MMSQSSTFTTRRSCDYCGLEFSGPGHSAGPERNYCCYGCYLVERIVGSSGEQGIAASILVRLGIGAFLSMNVMMISLVLYAHPDAELGVSAVAGLRWALVILSTPAIAILGTPFIMGAAKDIRRGRFGIDALIVTGSITAYAVSARHVAAGSGHIYFDTATMLLLIVTLGRLMEAAAKNRTSQAIREMMDLLPNTARIRRGRQEVEIPIGEVKEGDLMIVRPGERIPADGRVVSGECMVQEAAFTGEARPRACAPGDGVFGGSVNCDGLVEVEATAVGAKSLLAQIQSMVRRSQRERAPVERMAERVASVFAPVVWLVAAGAAVYWGVGRHDLEQAGLSALAVLVVACPCALGLATPMAVCLGIGRAARAGVLIRSGEVLELLPGIGRIFFDKTGTLTMNLLSVKEVRTAPEVSEEEAIAWTASLEAGSEHGIAKAVVAEAGSRGIRLGEIAALRSIPGRGVSGTVRLNGRTRDVTVGTLKLLEDGHVLPDALLQAANDPSTVAFVGWDGRVQAAFRLEDTARADALQTVRELTAMGIAATVISGDRETPTRRLAEEVSIPSVLFECAPAEKAAAVRDARNKRPGAVAMVGDGINDAPALAEANVGIAVFGGTDLARQASDLTLLGDDLTRIPWVLGLAKTTYRIVKQNLWWAFGYNSVAIVLAFAGYLHPLIAAGAMTFSSLAVIANSMRLRIETRRHEKDEEREGSCQ